MYLSFAAILFFFELSGDHRDLHSFPTRRSSDLLLFLVGGVLLHAGVTGLFLRYVKAGLRPLVLAAGVVLVLAALATVWYARRRDRKSTRLNSSHANISYAVFCLNKKRQEYMHTI